MHWGGVGVEVASRRRAVGRAAAGGRWRRRARARQPAGGAGVQEWRRRRGVRDRARVAAAGGAMCGMQSASAGLR